MKAAMNSTKITQYFNIESIAQFIDNNHFLMIKLMYVRLRDPTKPLHLFCEDFTTMP